MSRSIPESDWKTLRQLQPELLERFCRRILDEVVAAAGQEGQNYHQRYLRVYQLMREEDKTLGDAFDDLKRSNALIKLMQMRSLGLLRDEEFARFGAEVRNLFDGIPRLNK